jgi:hypothetical protein
MALLVTDCPRCGAEKITFDVKAQIHVHTQFDWRHIYEIFSVCRSCFRPTIFVVGLNSKSYNLAGTFNDDDALVRYQGGLTQYFEVEGFVNLRDNALAQPPEHLPSDIEKIFKEATTCLAVRCYNAAATMFRLTVDLTTRPLLPAPEDTTTPQPNSKQRRDLGLRLAWLFDNGKLPPDLRELAKCIREDANDGAHVGNLTKADAEDSLDFTTALLERLITEPKKLQLAQARRNARRS